MLIYDIRYLGRGGIPHFSSRVGPRFATFLPVGCLPDSAGGSEPQLLVGSGQTFGGFELITPFETNTPVTQFFQPELVTGESMTTVDFTDGELIIGTSYGRVLQYSLTNYQKTVQSLSQCSSSGGFSGQLSYRGGSGLKSTVRKEKLDMPPFIPTLPDVSLDPTILCSSYRADNQILQGWNVFDSYVMASNPIVSEEKMLFHPRYARGQVSAVSLGPMTNKALVSPSKRWLSKELQTKIAESTNIGGHGADVVKVFPASSLQLSDLLASVATSEVKGNDEPHPNPNKLLYSDNFAACYDATADPRKKSDESRKEQYQGEEDLIENEESGIPKRYRITAHPPFYKVANFDYTRYSETGLWVGWDYPSKWHNSWACSVLTLLYFVPEIKKVALQSQLQRNHLSQQSTRVGVSVVSELGLLFHLIESLSANSVVSSDGQVKAFVPSNFISAFTLLPEANNLALVDGVAGATEVARRPEAFYRFLVQYLDKELLQQGGSSGTIDGLQGLDFVSIIEYSSGKPKSSKSRALTVDLSYDQRWSFKKETSATIRFGDVLRYSLCREAPLRAWCDETRSYEAVVQRKIATSLPSLLSLSCCCAGVIGDTYGLPFWQQKDRRNWLPEFIEVTIETDQSITVKEQIVDDDGNKEWMVFSRKLPPSTSLPTSDKPIQKSYSLQAVISFIRNNPGSSSGEGHHVVHVKASASAEMESLVTQLHKIDQCLSDKESDTQQQQITLLSNVLSSTLNERRVKVQDKIAKANEVATEETVGDDDWLLINGFVVSKTSADDVRSFNAKIKEPSIVLFREINEDDIASDQTLTDREEMVSTSVMDTVSISTGKGPLYSADSYSGKFLDYCDFCSTS